MFSCPKTVLTGHRLHTDSQKPPSPQWEKFSEALSPRPRRATSPGQAAKPSRKAAGEGCLLPGLPGDSRTHLPAPTGGQLQTKEGHSSCAAEASWVCGKEGAFTIRAPGTCC